MDSMDKHHRSHTTPNFSRLTGVLAQNENGGEDTFELAEGGIRKKRKRVRIAWTRSHVLVHFVPGGQLSVACNVAALPRAGTGCGWGGAGEGRPSGAGRLRAAASRGVAAGAQSRVGVDRRHANGRPFVDAAPPC